MAEEENFGKMGLESFRMVDCREKRALVGNEVQTGNDVFPAHKLPQSKKSVWSMEWTRGMNFGR